MTGQTLGQQPNLTPPIVSLAGMRSENPVDRAAVADVFRAACLDKGFLYIVDHDIPNALVDSVFAETRRFFALPLTRKLEVGMAHSPYHRGYEPLRGQVLETGTPPDIKEGFYLGNELPEHDPRVKAKLFDHGPNQWPDNLAGFRETLDLYFQHMERLCRLTMRVLALALDLSEDYFEHFCDSSVSNLKLLHYPPQPSNAHPEEKGCGAHTDWGAITYLLQDNIGGLQVWDEGHGWIDAPPVGGALILNLGDLIARWTNDRFRSTLHRVINRSGKARYSVPFFFTGRPDHEVVCLPSCLAEGEIPKYPPTTTLEHLKMMYDRSYMA